MDVTLMDVTLMAGCLPRTPFREQVAAAASAGFTAITSWPNVWRHARKRDGLTLADMRVLLDDHGLMLTDVELVADWVPAADAGPFARGTSREEAFEVATALGASTLCTSHAVDGDLVLDRDAESFARLCDDAAEHGLRVALEFVPFTGIPDLATAARVIDRAGRPNAGLVVDVWHLARSGGTPDGLRRVRPEAVFTVQLADGPAAAPLDLVDDAMFHRLPPGTGELPLVDSLAVLAGAGVQAPVGPEVYRAGRPAKEVAAELYAATVDVLGASR
jgi:sugar phosphate isomerase/epimerase